MENNYNNQMTINQLLDIIDAAADGILAVDMFGRVLVMNARFREIWRIPDDFAEFDDLTLLNYAQQLVARPEDFLDRVRELYQDPEEVFDLLQFKDGRFYERYSKPLWKDGEIVGRVWSLKDITERKVAAETQLLQQRQLQQIIDLVPINIFAKDQNGRYIMANQATVELLQTTAQEIVGKSDLDFEATKEFKDSYVKDDLEVIRTGKPKKIQEKIVTSNGFAYIETTKIPFSYLGSEEAAILGVAVDITERKHAAEEMERLRDEALRASNAKSEFLAMISHEIRTPMNAILGMAELLSESPLNEEQKEYVEIFKRSGENLLRIINDVLDISKIEAGHIEIEYLPIDIDVFFQEIAMTFSYEARKKDIEFHKQ